jgi:hypothetical protein
MKSIRLYLLSACMLLVMAMPAMAQSARLDSLQRVQRNIELQSQQLQLQYDSLYRIIAQCKTDDERLVQYAVMEKFDKQNQQLGNKMRKIEQEILIEKARIEQEQRDAQLAPKQAAAQAMSPVPLKGEINGHPWVDLGLPSGTKWATYNVGTTAIHGVGTRIAWGETATKKLFSPDTYKHNGVELPSYAGNAEYDLATLQWGDDWYTPTLQQWEELIEHCQWEYVMINGIHGVLFTSLKTYNTIFLPSTGYTDDETYKLKYTTYNLAYWTSTGIRTNGAYSYIANYEQGYMTTTNRYVAHCVRAVCGTPSKAAAAIQDASAAVQEISTAIQGTAVVVPDTSSTAQPTKTHKKSAHSIKETAKTVNETAKAVKKTAETIKTLHNIFKH